MIPHGFFFILVHTSSPWDPSKTNIDYEAPLGNGNISPSSPKDIGNGSAQGFLNVTPPTGAQGFLSFTKVTSSVFV